MTLRERILAVYAGETPDVVPYMLDLSHWFYSKTGRPWDLSQSFTEPERDLIDYHREAGVGFYMPNMASFYQATDADDVISRVDKVQTNGVPEIVWHLETPLGTIERRRIWEPVTYAWGISQWGVRSESDLRVLGHALGSRRYASDWQQWGQWDQCVGDTGLVYLSAGYSAMGHLLNYWMGIEQTMYATVDMPDVMEEVVTQINDNQLELIDLLCQSPAQVIIMGDNFSSDIQPPHFFERWSKPYYAEAIRRLHDAGKYVAVHIDGKLAGALGMFREIGTDCADAVTPPPLGDLTPAACRQEAGDMILSGGVSPELWLQQTPEDAFDAFAEEWLALKSTSSRFIANAGDQVPPGAVETRIERLRQIVESSGGY
ncbi:MAG: hypothetical protein HN712_22010 [Gemmatimonadetes bacterium]|nr:hypothetical protein [Gemmatimonadota bacterium]MBT7863004.1 hypothetical protein [Gemmatimonadota bacterium]